MRRRYALGILACCLSLAPTRADEGIEIRGRVVTDGGAPLPNATLVLKEALDGLTAEADLLAGREAEIAARAGTDERGRYRLLAPSAGLWTLTIEAEGFAPLETRLTPLIEPSVLPDAVLGPDDGMQVRVTDATGRPLPGAFVVLRPDRSGRFRSAESWQAPLRAGRTDADGRLRLPRAGDEVTRVAAWAAGRAVSTVAGQHGTAAMLSLKPSGRRRLRVLSADGTPAAGVLVAVGREVHPSGWTDATGEFVVDLPAGAAETKVVLLAEDGRRLETRVAPASEENRRVAPLELRLPRRIEIAGRLIDALTRRSIAGALVWDAGDPLELAVTSGSGGYTLGGPAGRRMPLTAGAPGYLPAAPIEHQIAAGRRAPTLVLRPGGLIVGHVEDADGRPVAGAAVTAEERRNPSGEVRIEIGGRREEPRALADEDGAFRLGPLDPEKDWLVRASAEGLAPGETVVPGLEPHRTRKGVRVVLDRGAVLAGTVVDEQGRGIGEVALELAPAPRRGGAIEIHGPEQALPAFAGVSDDDGRFEIAGLPAGRFDLSLRRAGFARRSVSAIEIGEDPGTVEVGEIELRAGQRMQGLVRDRAGAPIEGVEVHLQEAAPRMAFMLAGVPESEPAAVTDPAGWFAVEELAEGKRYSLSFRRRGYVERSVGQLEVPRPEPLEVTLQPSSDVSGVVLDPDGEPIAGARVELKRSRTAEMGGNVMKMIMVDNDTTDAGGRFLFADQEPGTVSLSAEAAGFREAKLDGIEVPAGEDVTGVELPLEPGAVVVGQVLAPDGRPAIGAEVRKLDERPQEFRFGGSPTDGEGRYRLEGLGPGPASIEVVHRDYPRAVRDLEVAPGVNNLDFVLEGGVEVEGLVLAEDGAPIGGATVRLLPTGRYWGGPETSAEPDGRFRLSGVNDGDYTLWAGAEGYAAANGERHLTVAGEPLRGIEVRLERGGAIVGRVSGLADDELSRVRVRAEGGSFFGLEGTPADYRGEFRIDHLRPGTYDVVGEVTGTGKRASERVELAEGQDETRVELRFGGGLTLSGRAIQGQSPLANVNVFAEGLDVDSEGWTNSDPAGRFSIEGLKAGRYRVRLRDWTSGLAHDETFDLATSREVELRVPTARVAGRVVDSADARPLSGVTLELHSDDPDDAGRLPTHSATTDLEGKFEIGGVGDGAWRLTASRKGYAALSRQLNVQHERSVDDLRLGMDSTEGVTLEARLPTGAIPEELRVAVLDPAGGALLGGNYATGENGRVRLSSVPAGNWELLVSGTGSATSALAVRAPGGPVPVQLEPPTALTVRVPALAAAPTVATVAVRGADGRPFRALGWSGQPQAEWRTDDGLMEFRSLPPGGWTVTVTAVDGRSWSGEAVTGPGAPAELVLD